jgi:GNAT superfamily N-acetyltransferase
VVPRGPRQPIGHQRGEEHRSGESWTLERWSRSTRASEPTSKAASRSSQCCRTTSLRTPMAHFEHPCHFILRGSLAATVTSKRSSASSWQNNGSHEPPEITFAAVRPQLRGGGIGTLLIERAFDDLSRRRHPTDRGQDPRFLGPVRAVRGHQIVLGASRVRPGRRHRPAAGLAARQSVIHLHRSPGYNSLSRYDTHLLRQPH